MVTRRQIDEFVRRVARRFRPTSIILFGSHAYGQPTPDSDVDLMVIMPHRGSNVDVATKIRLACPRSFPMDLMVRTPGEVQRRLRLGDSFLKDILSRGIVLHEARHA